MNGLQLYIAMSHIDPQLTNGIRPVERRSRLPMIISMAACLCVAVIGVTAFMLTRDRSTSYHGDSGSYGDHSDTGGYEDHWDSGGYGEDADNGSYEIDSENGSSCVALGTLEELFRRADNVFIGDIVAENGIQKEVKVTETFKEYLVSPGQTVTIRDEELSGVPALKEGMRVLVFTNVGYGGLHTVTDGYYGKYIFDNDGNIHSFCSLVGKTTRIADIGDVIAVNEMKNRLNTLKEKQQ